MMSRYFTIPCKIERGGFSTERLFTIAITGEQKTYAGYYEHFLNENGDPLDLNSPSEGEVLDGYAKCRLIQKLDDGTFIINIPSSDSLLVPEGELVEDV